MDAARRKRMINGALTGLVSGLILSLVCYFGVSPNPSYLMFTAFGLAIGAGQGYVSCPKE
jgi:dolichol kinase